MNLYVVTGTTKGLGEALARRIEADPANILVAIARGTAASPARGLHIRADLARGEDIHRAGDELAAFVAAEASLPSGEGRAGGSFERAVLINNAGVVSPVGLLDEVDPAELERNLVVNLVAPLLLMRAFLRATEGRAAVRRVINISSGAGRRPISGWSGYCAAKAGLDMASRVAALEAEQRASGVEVVSLAPGVIDTAMQGVVRSSDARDFADVERFRQMKAEGALRPAGDVAADILRLEAAGKLRGEPIADLRAIA
jgi:benzil reductase ((S)-benzoin forming)